MTTSLFEVDDAFDPVRVNSGLRKAWLKLRNRLIRAATRPPFRDEQGRKRFFERISRARPHLVRHVPLKIDGWPQWSRPLRVIFLSDFHTGSHSRDVERLKSIVAEAQALNPDLVLFGGDFVNMQPFCGGRVPPRVVAGILAKLDGACGRFAVLGNHDHVYDADEVAQSLRESGIIVLSDERTEVMFEEHSIDLVGIPDNELWRARTEALLSRLSPQRPTIVLTHDPMWFASVPTGPHLTLAGHTHGGQVNLPGLGIITNSSRAPLRWSHGLVAERGMHLYVTSGIGTSLMPLRWRVAPEISVLDVTGTSQRDLES